MRIDETRSTMGPLDFAKALYRYLKPYRTQTFFLLILLFINTAFLMGWPLSFKFLIDKGIADRNWDVLMKTILVLTAGVLVASLAGVARGYLYAYLSSNVLKDIRQRVFRHLQQLSMSYYKRTTTGDIMARFSTDLTSLENVVTNAAPTLIMQGLGVVFGSVVLFTVEWRIAVITVFGLLLCVILPIRLARRTANMGYDFKNKEARLAQTVQENISAQPVVKAFGLTEKAIREFVRETVDLALVSLRFGFSADNVERIPAIIILIFEILTIAAGVILVFRDQITLGTLVALHAIYIHISFSVIALTKVVPMILRSIGGLQRIEDLLAESPEVVERPDARSIPPFSSDIRFQDVSFSYSNDSLTLNNISLKIPKGSFVAFVGPSGCGKSTILNLLLRFYEPKEGNVFIDGVDENKISFESLRSQMAVVFQESFLFNSSIQENIRLGKPDATEEEIRSAAEAAGIHDSILRMPAGYDTLVGERGSFLSGGQRQRIAIARALLRNPPILVLDEATSALDPETEHAINQTLSQIGQGRTVISVTHRLSSAMKADSIFLLKDGSIMEQGKHEELLEAEGLYSQLWHKQTGFTFSDGSAQVHASRLKRYPIFEGVEYKLLEKVASLFVTESYPADTVVVREGAPGDRFYLITHGTVAVMKTTPDGVSKTVDVLEDGDYFGEIALIKNIPRSASIRTLTSCVTLSLHRDIFNHLLDSAPGLRQKLEQAIVSRASHIKKDSPAAKS